MIIQNRIQTIEQLITTAANAGLTQVTAFNITPNVADAIYDHFTLIGFEVFYSEKTQQVIVSW